MKSLKTMKEINAVVRAAASRNQKKVIVSSMIIGFLLGLFLVAHDKKKKKQGLGK